MRVVNIRLVIETDDGGIRQSERQYIPELKRRGISVVGVVLGETTGNYADQPEDFPYLVNWIPSLYTKSFFSRTVGFLKNYFKAGTVADHILANIASPEIFPNSASVIVNIRRVTLLPVAVDLAKKVGGRVVYHSGGSFNKSSFGVNYIFYWALRKSRSVTILANSKYSRDSYRLEENNYVYPGFSHRRLLTAMACPRIRDQLGIDPCAPVFLYFARVNWDKAPDILTRAFVESDSAKTEGAHLIIAGPVQDERLLKNIRGLIYHYQLQNYIHIVGSQKNAGDWYSVSDVFVNSRRGAEPFGISIVEAMGAGLPILSSALGGPSETIRDGYNGWLIHDLSVDGYSKGIQTALSWRRQWSTFGQRSAEMAKSYSVEEQVGRYVRYGLHIDSDLD